MDAALSVRIGADVSAAKQAFREMEAATKSLADGLKGIGKRLSIGLTAPIGAVAAMGVRSAMALEVLESTLTTLLGSAEDAGRVFAELREYEFSSIFSGPELEQSARQLAAFGTEASRIVPTIDTLGNVAAGLSIPLTDIVDVYGRMQVSGRVTMRELTQLMQRGVPVVQELAKNLGVTEAKVQEMASAGKLSFSMIEGAFASMTGEGGKFFNMMAAQGDTLQGKMAFLRKDFEGFADQVGEVLIPILSKLIDVGRDLFEWFGELDEGTQRVIITVGLAAAAIGPLLAGLGAIIAIAPSVAAAWALITGPIGLAVIAITAVVAAAIFFRKQIQQAFYHAAAAVASAMASVLKVLARVTSVVPGLGSLSERIAEAGRAAERTAGRFRDMAAGVELTAKKIRELSSQLMSPNLERLGIFGAGQGAGPPRPVVTGGGDPGELSDLEKRLRAIAAMVRDRVVTAFSAAEERASALRSALRDAYEESGGRLTAGVAALIGRLREAEAEVRALTRERELRIRLRFADLGAQLQAGLLTPLRAVEERAKRIRAEVARVLSLNGGELTPALQALLMQARELERQARAMGQATKDALKPPASALAGLGEDGLVQVPALINDVREGLNDLAIAFNYTLQHAAAQGVADLADGIGQATGALLTLEGGFGEFATSVVRSLRQVIAQVVAMIARMLALRGILAAFGWTAGGGGFIGAALRQSAGLRGLSGGLASAPSVAARLSGGEFSVTMSGDATASMLLAWDQQQLSRGRPGLLDRLGGR